MTIKVIKTEKDYEYACSRIYELMKSSTEPLETRSPEGEEIELLALLVERYENEHFPIDAPDPVAAIRFRMEQMNLRQVDIAPLFGSPKRVSEVLRKKRPLNLRMITLLHRYLGIPLESLISNNKDVELDADNRKKLLRVKSIEEYLKRTKSYRKSNVLD